MWTILKLLGRDTAKLLGGIYSPIPPPPGFGTPGQSYLISFSVEDKIAKLNVEIVLKFETYKQH